jgi:tetratricopeptide (TPR) repeat protein
MSASTAMNDAPAAKPAAAKASPAGGPASKALLSRGMWKVGVGLTALVVASGGVTWWMTRPVQQDPAEQVAKALKLLDQGKFAPAREIAARLQKQNYRHPGFAGVLEFIQGMAAFGLVEASGESPDGNQYEVVIRHLREAERLALGNDHRPEWSYALGKSLYMTHNGWAARPLLEEALDTYPPARVDSAEMLIDLYLDPGIRTSELLDRALEMNDELLQSGLADEEPAADDDAAATPGQMRQTIAWLQRAEILLAMKRFDEAHAVLDAHAASASGGASPASRSTLFQILKARILLAEGRFADALARVRPIAMSNRIGQDHVAEACYLAGLANEGLSEGASLSPEDRDQARRDAIFFFERASGRFAGSSEATAADLHLGRLWGLQRSHEQSLQAYGSALRAVPVQVETYRNRWLSVEQFRQAILDAWNGWVREGQFKEAIALSEMMTPLFPRSEAYEFAARVHQHWAEELEDQLNDMTYTERQKHVDELRRRWRQSGEAYVRLAEVRLSSAKYPEALWNAAEHFRRGHDFERSLELINQFLATEPERLMATALVQRARIELDLDRIPAALADLQQVVRKYPTDPATFTAQYLIGACHLELNELDQAEEVWRSILLSDQLLPSAVEWRDAQLSLGRLMFEKGELVRRRGLLPSSNATSSSTDVLREASPYWQEAARLLSRYLDRYAGEQGATEARYYLGKSLQREAEWLTRQWEIAETDNARQQLEKQQDATLGKALYQFRLLRDELLTGQNKDRIDDLERRLLMNCYFEIPHTLFRLRAYSEAIDEYNSAVSRYPQDVQTLVAFLQMGQCYHRLGRPEEARSMLQQAKVILSYKEHIPDAAFQSPSTNLSRTEWEAWLDRARLAQ